MTAFDDIYRGKKVLITGHSGFKGSWLSLWLNLLGAEVFGYSLSVPTSPSLFEVLELDGSLQSYFKDIRDQKALTETVSKIEPDFIFHLAAQSLVSKSYENPLQTITTNVLGTANLLETLRTSSFPCTAIIITSDKCYRNKDDNKKFSEEDPFGGRDLYSASKSSAELITHSYYHSFFKGRDSIIKIATARAGNVIGGGDWSDNRLVPDCIRSWSENKPAEIRNPEGIRPWQHVLEPLSAYLLLGSKLNEPSGLSGQSFNFGPDGSDVSVKRILEGLWSSWDSESRHDPYFIPEHQKFSEDTFLKLDCQKAHEKLNWRTVMDIEETLEFTGIWYKNYYTGLNMAEFTKKQIKEYQKRALSCGADWLK